MNSEQAKETVERIRQARRVISQINPDLFDMGSWTGFNGCGTTHCVGGWLRLDPWFQENTSILDMFTVDYGYVYVSEWSITNDSVLATLLAGVMGIGTSEAKTLFGLPLGRLDAPETIEDTLKLLDVLEEKYAQIAEGRESN